MARMTQTEIISSLAGSTGATKAQVKSLFDALSARDQRSQEEW